MSFLASLYRWQFHARQRLAALSCCRAAGGPLREPPRRALFVMSGLLGDTVMSLPVLQEARRLWPAARLMALGLPHNRELLASFSAVDDFQVTPARPFSLRQGGCPASLVEWLRGQRFDVAVILLGDHFAASLAAADVPVRVGSRGHVLERCLTHAYDPGTPREWGPNERLNALRVLGYDVREVLPRLHATREAAAAARAELTRLGLPAGTPYAAIHPFGSTARQWWPMEKLAHLAAALERDLGFRTVVVGGPETRGRVPAGAGLIDATGTLTIPQLVAALDAAALVVSTDSGPFHIAGALERPLVGLFRASRPEHGSRYSQAHIAFGRHPTCAGRCTWDYCRRHPCREMRAIGLDEVMDRVGEALGRNDTSGSSSPVEDGSLRHPSAGPLPPPSQD